jgi:tetratricopeptide (TPR) repeat protein
MKNMNWWDRIIRLILAVVLVELAYFWLGGVGAILAYGLGTVLTVTSLIGFCPLYKPIGISTLSESSKQLGKVGAILAAAVLLMVLFAGSYASAFFSRKIFVEEFNVMNNYYKQALFQTGQNDRDKAIANYEQWVSEYAKFEKKYIIYQPFAIKGDGKWSDDLKKIEKIITDVHDNVYTGDLHQAHLTLEQVRPVFQDVFKRNNFSMLSIALVDFHDAMELILDASNAKDSQKVIALYPQLDEKFKAVEQVANDDEIQAIRKNLDEVLKLAQDNKAEELPGMADKLKSSFVKVYLKRG